MGPFWESKTYLKNSASIMSRCFIRNIRCFQKGTAILYKSEGLKSCGLSHFEDDPIVWNSNLVYYSRSATIWISTTIITLSIDSFTPGWRTGSSFFQILYRQSQQDMVLLSFVDIQKIWFFTKFGGCSSKIEPARPFWIWNSRGHGRLNFSATPSKFWSMIDFL